MKPEDFQRNAPGKLIRTPQDYWAFVPDPLPPRIEWSLALISAHGEAERNLGRLASLAAALPLSKLWLRPFVRREAVLSSRIEGTQASLADLYQYDFDPTASLKTVADVGEVHNYGRALEYGVERLKTLPLSLRLIRELQQILLQGVRGDASQPGEFRRSQNWIGSPGSTLAQATYVPPPVEEMHVALSALENYIHQPADLPPLCRAGLIHYQFEAIHPFLDGNGRVGRLLVILLLMAWGLIPQPLLYLSAFFEARRMEYYDRLLNVSQRGDWEAWLAFFLEGISSQALDALRRIERLKQLRDGYQERLAGERAAERLFQALDVLFERPVLNVNQLASALGTPYRTAQRYMERLIEVGILQESSGRLRGRIYRASEILAAIDA